MEAFSAAKRLASQYRREPRQIGERASGSSERLQTQVNAWVISNNYQVHVITSSNLLANQIKNYPPPAMAGYDVKRVVGSYKEKSKRDSEGNSCLGTHFRSRTYWYSGSRGLKNPAFTARRLSARYQTTWHLMETPTCRFRFCRRTAEAGFHWNWINSPVYSIELNRRFVQEFLYTFPRELQLGRVPCVPVCFEGDLFPEPGSGKKKRMG